VLSHRHSATTAILNMFVEAECTHRTLASTRNPVSSTWATPVAAIPARIVSRTPDARTSPAIRTLNDATVPADSGVPNNSASASAVRAVDRNCPAYR
jgi:hypothetical protein